MSTICCRRFSFQTRLRRIHLLHYTIIALQFFITGALLWAPLLLQAEEINPRKTYNIPAGSLENTVKQFARQAGITLSFDPALVANKNTSALQGDYTTQGGLAILLARHRLEAVQITDKTYSLQPTSQSISAADTTVLPMITIQEEFEREGVSRGFRAHYSNATGFGNQSLLDTPHSVNVITREVIEEQRAATLKEILKNDASVQLGADNRQNEAQIRGFWLDNWQNYQRDGLKTINQAGQPIENIERVEVLKGLSGTYYGLGTPSGIINYVIKRPGTEPLTRLWVDANHYGGYRVRTDISRPLTTDGRHGIRINAAYEDLTSHVRRTGDDDRYFFSVAYLGQLGPSTQLFIDADYHRVQSSLAGCFYGAPGGTEIPRIPDPRRSCAQPWSFFKSTVWNVSARLEHAITDWLSAQVHILHNDLMREESGAYSAFYDIDTSGNATVYDYTSLNEIRRPTSYRTSLNALFDTGPIEHDLTVGFMGSNFDIGWDEGRFEFIGIANQASRFPIFAQGTTPYDRTRTKMDRFEYAFYGMDTLSLGERWKLQAGVRHQVLDFRTRGGDHYNDSATTPSAALIFKPIPAMTTYFGYMQGFEEGGEVRGAQFSNNGNFLPPLRSHQMELGAKIEFSPGYLITAALFEANKGSILDTLTADGLLHRTQDGRQVHRGFELSLAGQVLPSLRMIASFMLLDAEFEKTTNPALIGKRPINVPSTAASFYADWNIPWLQGAGLTGGVYYTGSRAITADNSATAPGYVRFDLGARYAAKLGRRGIVLRAGVDNLTNERYWESVAFGSMLVGMPRTYRLTTQLDF